MNVIRFTGVLTLMAIVMPLMGCAQKLTYERWRMIEGGTSTTVVEQTLGRPWQQTDETWIYHDSDRGITVTMYFRNGQIVSKEWADPQRGIEGDSPMSTDHAHEERIEVQVIE